MGMELRVEIPVDQIDLAANPCELIGHAIRSKFENAFPHTPKSIESDRELSITVVAADGRKMHFNALDHGRVIKQGTYQWMRLFTFEEAA